MATWIVNMVRDRRVTEQRWGRVSVSPTLGERGRRSIAKLGQVFMTVIACFLISRGSERNALPRHDTQAHLISRTPHRHGFACTGVKILLAPRRGDDMRMSGACFQA